ncbi:PAAR domain-containing protein [Jiella sp. MQZ9-1]|uniref:PAAR domain-containing protein n=1 Tax=Jiella flava TaxID=2816857 RepID=A0A939FZ26_9HYPH|nr:PAAR domain-containing protein [Jiella flava]MBO0664122.1 PAAR domain-containing protein [Jiella flava]MCD2472694.1 PAAR domain-containing protein [Jiella flava]
MPPAHRQGDIGSGHGCHFPPSAATGGSPDVFTNGRPQMRVGDTYAPRSCVAGHAGPHGRALAQGSASVFINGRKAGRLGDEGPGGGRASCQKSMAGQSTPFVRG